MEDLDDSAAYSNGKYQNTSLSNSSSSAGVHDFGSTTSTNLNSSSTSTSTSKTNANASGKESSFGETEGGLADRDEVPGRSLRPHKLRQALATKEKEIVGVKGDIASQKMIREG